MDVQYALSIFLEVLWTLLKVNYEVIKAMVRTIVPPGPKSVDGHVVLISGTGHGIGREMALRFAALGAAVVCVDINDKTNEETVKMIKQEKHKAFKYQCDVTDYTAVMQLADRVRKEVGDVDILVNNAGIMPCRPVLEQTVQEITLMNKLNINANIWMIQAFLPDMMRRNYGHIVAMSSMAGLQGIRNLVPYSGSKYAVKGIMDSLAVELRDDARDLSGIKTTTIFPYIVDTGLCKNPRVRFKSLMKVVEPGYAADLIVNAVRRNYNEITIPQDLYFVNRFIFRLLPFEAGCIWVDFFDTGVDPQD